MTTSSGGRDIQGTFVKTNDIGVLAAAVVLFVFSFFHWFTAKACVSGFGCRSDGASAWHVGFLSWAGVLLGLLAAAAVAVRVFQPGRLPSLAVGPHVAALGLAALGTLLVLLRFLLGYSDGGISFVKVHRGLGLYVGLIALVVETVFAFLAFTASGESLPGRPSSSPAPHDPGAPTV